MIHSIPLQLSFRTSSLRESRDGSSQNEDTPSRAVKLSLSMNWIAVLLNAVGKDSDVGSALDSR